MSHNTFIEEFERYSKNNPLIIASNAEILIEVIDDILSSVFLISKARKRRTAIEVDMYELLKEKFRDLTKQFLTPEFQEKIENLFLPKNIEIDKATDKPKIKKKPWAAFTAVFKKVFGKEFPKEVLPEVDKLTELSFKDNKRITGNRLNLTSSFNTKDEGTVKQLKKQNKFWIGDSYSRSLEERINKIGQEVVEQGLDRKSAAKIFQSKLSKEFSKTDNYWKILASVVVNRTKSYSQLSMFRDAGYITYEILAVMDERTCPRCRSLNGRQYQVSRGIELMEEALKAKSPEEHMKIKPWLEYEKPSERYYYKIGEERKYLGKEIKDRALDKAGIIFPPFHPACRCDIVITVD